MVNPETNTLEIKLSETNLSKPHLLIAENDCDLQDMYSLLLEEKYELHQATSIEEAFKILKTSNIDVAMLDYKLNDGYSLDVLNYCKESGIKTILISAGKREATADIVLMKPCELGMIENALEYCLNADKN